MKKSLFVILSLVLIASFALTACGGAAPATEEPMEETHSEEPMEEEMAEEEPMAEATEEPMEEEADTTSAVADSTMEEAPMEEEAAVKAQAEKEKILAAGHAEIETERNQAKEELRKQVAVLAIAGAEKILERSIDAAAHSDILDKLVAEL